MKATKISQLLPFVFQEAAGQNGPLQVILQVMEDLHAPPELLLKHMEVYFDPYRAPDDFIPYLASWVDLEGVLDQTRSEGEQTATFRGGLGRLRELVAAAGYLSQWRGTRKGLLMFLQTATGHSGFTIEEETHDSNGKVIPFHLRIVASADTVGYRSLIERIIELEKPAYVTYELSFAESYAGIQQRL